MQLQAIFKLYLAIDLMVGIQIWVLSPLQLQPPYTSRGKRQQRAQHSAVGHTVTTPGVKQKIMHGYLQHQEKRKV